MHPPGAAIAEAASGLVLADDRKQLSQTGSAGLV
jgi:hypothetical protein